VEAHEVSSEVLYSSSPTFVVSELFPLIFFSLPGLSWWRG
jgi:hypothetical protein